MSRSVNIRDYQRNYQRLRHKLATTEWICNGSVIKRSYRWPAGKRGKTYGPYYSWTRKVANKTVTLALSQEQYHSVQSAIAMHRHIEGVLDQMRRLSEKFILATTPSVPRRSREQMKLS